MNKEVARQILEDWFIEHPEDMEVFCDEALDRLLDIVAYAVSRPADAAPAPPEAACVDAIVADFLARVPAMMRERVPGAPSLDVRSLGARERDQCRRVVAAGLALARRREALLKDLERVKVDASSVARAASLSRCTLSPARSPLLTCAVAFMKEYAAAREGRPQVDPSVQELRSRLEVVLAELRREKELSLMKDSSEVKYRREKAAREKVESDLAAVQEEKGKLAERLLWMKEICCLHGIDVHLEIDEMERLEAAARAHRAMQKGDGMAS